MTNATLVALASLVIAAGPAFAGEPHGHGGPRLRSSVPTRVFPHHRVHGHHGNQGRAGVGAPVIGYGYGITYAAPEYLPPPRSYVLQRDGMAAPYRGVWLPTPPSEEPPAPPPAPPAPAASGPVPSLDYYRWTDADGVTHLTDSIDRVPEQYRAKATKART